MKIMYSSLITALATLSTGALPPSARPSEADRKFRSSAVDAKIADLKPKLKDPALAIIFENCWPNTLDTTIGAAGANDSFVITGDIDAMWLRDSTNQVLPYVSYAAQDPALGSMLRGVVMRQLRSVIMDPYANAFNEEANGHGRQTDVRTPPMTPGVFEGKYELDSLAAVLKLSTAYWRVTGDDSVLGAEWLAATEVILDTCEAQQMSTAEQSHNAETYSIANVYGETYPGAPANRTGMVRSAFRPSDDRTTYDFLVPANLMMAAALEAVVDAAASISTGRAAAISSRAAAMAAEIKVAAMQHGTVDGRYVFEVDGFGGSNEMDDANVPSLLSLPYLGAMDSDDPTYLATRSWVLSSANPFFYAGSVAQGIGSPHTPVGNIWPMSIIQQALTSNDDEEILRCLGYLVAAAESTGFMHESFQKDDAESFSRSWFAWANALFGELILNLAEERPHLVLKDAPMNV